MIQAIAQAIPLYVINCFKFPRSLLHDLNRLVTGYWWGDSVEKGKLIGKDGMAIVYRN